MIASPRRSSPQIRWSGRAGWSAACITEIDSWATAARGGRGVVQSWVVGGADVSRTVLGGAAGGSRRGSAPPRGGFTGWLGRRRPGWVHAWGRELRRAVRVLDRHPRSTRTRTLADVRPRWREPVVEGAVVRARGSFEGRTIEAMRAGRVTAACFCAVADLPTLDAGAGGLRSIRDFDPGEAYAAYRTQIANLQALVADGQVVPVLAPATSTPPPRPAASARSWAWRGPSSSRTTWVGSRRRSTMGCEC
jgi:hypothetical protein